MQAIQPRFRCFRYIKWAHVVADIQVKKELSGKSGPVCDRRLPQVPTLTPSPVCHRWTVYVFGQSTLAPMSCLLPHSSSAHISTWKHIYTSQHTHTDSMRGWFHVLICIWISGNWITCHILAKSTLKLRQIQVNLEKFTKLLRSWMISNGWVDCTFLEIRVLYPISKAALFTA